MYPDFGPIRFEIMEDRMMQFRSELLIPDEGDYLGLNQVQQGSMQGVPLALTYSVGPS